MIMDKDSVFEDGKLGYDPAYLTVCKRPGTSYQIEIRFAVVNHLYLLFSFVKLVET